MAAAVIAVLVLLAVAIFAESASASVSPDGSGLGLGASSPEFGADPLGGLLDMSNVDPNLVEQIAAAIAQAEGFTVLGSIPARAHNPGDLARGDIGDTGVYLQARGGVQIIVFASDNDGWNALRTKVRNMLSGASAVYSPGMSIAQVAQKYTGGDNAAAWANTVAAALGVDPATALQDLA